MIHQACGYDARVIESRPVNGQVRRRYECGRCSVRFTTYESVVNPAFNEHLKMAVKLLEAAMKLETT